LVLVVAQQGDGAAPVVQVCRSSARDELDSRAANFDLWLVYATAVDPTVTDPPSPASDPDPTGVFNNWAFWQYS